MQTTTTDRDTLIDSTNASLAVTVTKAGRSTRWVVNLAGAVAGLGDLRAGTLSVTDAGLAEYDEADDTDALAVRQGTNRAVRWCAGFTPRQGKWSGSKDVESPAAAVGDLEEAIWGDAEYDPKDARTRWLLSVLGLR